MIIIVTLIGFILWNCILYLIEPTEDYNDEIPRDILSF
jgi:hypothetical protein